MRDSERRLLRQGAEELAEVARKCLILGVSIASLWLVYLGVAAIVTHRLDLLIRTSSEPLFPAPLEGIAAVFGGLSLIALALGFLSTLCFHRILASRLPSWTRFLFLIFIGLYAALSALARA